MEPINIHFEEERLSERQNPVQIKPCDKIVLKILDRLYAESPKDYLEKAQETLMASEELMKCFLEANKGSIQYDKVRIYKPAIEQVIADGGGQDHQDHIWSIPYRMISITYRCLQILPDETFICCHPQTREIVSIVKTGSTQAFAE